MHIHTLYNFNKGIRGGGNQFLLALRHQFRQMGVYAEDAESADVILFNSHHDLREVFKLKKQYPEKHFVHRIGSAFTLARGDAMLDKLVYHANHNIADGTVFQSAWSKTTSHHQGLHVNSLETHILNAPDPTIFHPPNTKEINEKIRIITTGWAVNRKKGDDIYKYLDEHLDFTKYHFIFLGRTKENFKNIHQFPPQESRVVGSMLRGSEIFITATEDDACSNSLIEALHCGLPAVARNSGGHPEIVKGAGEYFEGKDDVVDAIERVSANIAGYKGQINLPSIREVAQQYFEFCWEVCELTNPKRVNTIEYLEYSIISKAQKIGEVRRQIRGFVFP